MSKSLGPHDYSVPDSSVYGISQARILEWVAMPLSRGSSQPRDQTCISYISSLARGFFIPSATRKALNVVYMHLIQVLMDFYNIVNFLVISRGGNTRRAFTLYFFLLL